MAESQIKKILLVDDMRHFLDLEVSFLKRADVQILTARDGPEALLKTRVEKPDLVILDIEMPQMSGIECCRIIKTDSAVKHIPVVIMTAHEKKDEGFKAGCNDFLVKPIDEDDFLRVIKKFVPLKEREVKRMAISIEVGYEFDKQKLLAYTRDISLTGIFVITRDLLPLGCELDLELVVPPADRGSKEPPTAVRTRAQIVRQEKEETLGVRISGVGLKFLDLEPSAKKALEELMARKTKKAGWEH